MRLASLRRLYVGFLLAAFVALSLAACKTQPSPWSPEVEEMYKRMYGPIIDGG
jgi:ABC-type nitrate/sulfonate/bicarbonate transport system permease component